MRDAESNRPHVLLIGKDARTDAIAQACIASEANPTLTVLSEQPIPGLLHKADHFVLGSLIEHETIREVVGSARRIDLAIIGPEEPLAAGVVDVLQDEFGITTFGPRKRLAAIEASKSWARALVNKYEIGGNPAYCVFDAPDEIRSYLKSLGEFVIKPDGLTGGKGVAVSGEHLHSLGEAVGYAEASIRVHGRVAIEERLEGEEFSLQTITDGEAFIHCPLVQDHKRAQEGDIGSNTGGMGSYSCPDLSLPFVEPADLRGAQLINERVIRAIAAETDEPYRGVLYGGFMATGDGIRLIEYNARFGDPEALNVLPLLRGDFLELCLAAATGHLNAARYSFAPLASVCKYIVPASYPTPTAEPGPIFVPQEQLHDERLHWYWAACQQIGDRVQLTTSRAGAFVGVAETLAEAEQIAETAAASVQGNVRHRRDIGKADVIESRVRHVRSLRSVGATTSRLAISSPI